MAKDYEDYRRRNERTQEAVRRRRNADYATRRSAGYYEDEDYSEPVRRARQAGSTKRSGTTAKRRQTTRSGNSTGSRSHSARSGSFIGSRSHNARSGNVTDSRRRDMRSVGAAGRRNKKRRHPIRRFLLCLLLIVALCVGGIFVYLVKSLNTIENHPLSDVTLCGEQDANIKNYTNIALFGVDSRANDLRKNTRSDSIIVASINNKTHDVKLVSIYRDTYVKIHDHGCTKINHAYAYGGPDLAVNTLNKNFDLNIKDFVTVNFSALTNVIDELGGVELTIKKEELKWVNAYGHNVAKINGQKYTKIKHPGKQTVTGVQATGYCRVRYTKGGDFTRAERQRTVLQAIFAKAKKSSPTALISAMNKIFPQIYTSLSTSDILSLMKYLPFYEIGDQQGFPYKLSCHRGRDGIYYDFPTTLVSNVKKLHKELFGTDNYEPSKLVHTISKETSN